jgi:hypothetical protein
MYPTRQNAISGRCGFGLPLPPRTFQSNVDVSNEESNGVGSLAIRKVGKPATGQPRIDGGAMEGADDDGGEEFWKISGWTMFQGTRVPHSREYMKAFDQSNETKCIVNLLYSSLCDGVGI